MNMLKQMFFVFTVVALFSVGVSAQATRYNPTGAVIAQANPTPTPKPTPTPANAQFIVAPSETTIDVPAQKLVVKMNNVPAGGGTGSAADLEKQLRAELKGFASQAEKTTGAVKTLNNEVNGLHNELEAEKSARAQADQNLQTQVDTVKADVGSLTSSLTLEVDNRKAEDAKLNNRVTKIEKEGSYGNIALWLAIAALIGLAIVVIWLSKRKPTAIIQQQPNPNQAGGSGGTPVNNPPSGDGSDPAKPLKLGTTKPETLPTSADNLKAPKADQLDFARKLTDEESRWFERAQNIWAEYREDGREGNFQRLNLKKRIIDPSKFEVLKAAIEREEARIAARNAKPVPQRPVFKRQPAEDDEKPAGQKPEVNDDGIKTEVVPKASAAAAGSEGDTDK